MSQKTLIQRGMLYSIPKIWNDRRETLSSQINEYKKIKSEALSEGLEINEAM